jgi:NitT/TauT family transport system permease protein
VLPAPSVILQTFIADAGLLTQSLLVTLLTTLEGFLLAAIGGVGLAVLFNQSRLVEYSLYPYAVILQVTPIVAIAPLLLIYLPQQAAVLACAWIVAFFPVLANTTLGLHSVDRNLVDLFSLYGASRWQMLWDLKLPAAMPFILGGLRIAGGLSLIGAVVAEIAAGSAGAGSGLAYRIAESGYRLNIPRMFAALLLIYLPQPLAVLACAWLVAFFPVLANTTLGLNSVDHNLLALFELYKASRWQVLWNLKLPAALPQMLAGLRIAGGLSLIGAVVAEIAAGSAGAGSGLAYRIAESGYRLNIPRMFAALLLLSVAGVAIFFVLSALSHLALRRWHESAVTRES